MILSPNSIESSEVKRELGVAKLNKTSIIPIILYPFDYDWLVENGLNAFQKIVYYRRPKACMVDLVNSMGGLRGVASLMPKKSNLAMRENTRFIVEMIKMIQEVTFQSGFVILYGGQSYKNYIQFSGQRNEAEIYAEAVGNKNLEKEFLLDNESLDLLLDFGWQKPKKNSFGNYWQKWEVHTNRDRATVALTILSTFLKVYKHYPGENFSSTEIRMD